jgi:hypothetical protein
MEFFLCCFFPLFYLRIYPLEFCRICDVCLSCAIEPLEQNVYVENFSGRSENTETNFGSKHFDVLGPVDLDSLSYSGN